MGRGGIDSQKYDSPHSFLDPPLELKELPVYLIPSFLFSDVYALCVANPVPYADRLYNETKSLLEYHVQDLRSRVSQMGKLSEGGLLMAYYHAWIEYSQGITYLGKLYS